MFIIATQSIAVNWIIFFWILASKILSFCAPCSISVQLLN